MMYKKAFFGLLAAAIVLSIPGFALACACCVDPGLYSIRTGRPSNYDLGLIKEFKFGRSASLYLTEAGFDNLKGLDEVASEAESEQFGGFDLVNNFTGKQWRFEVSTKSGKRGVLTLPIPTQIVTFKADIHDEPDDKPNGPNLYKEFRFKGSISGGSGIFRSTVARPSTYFLVFQGRGNGCDNVSDFTNWRLEISGARAAYAFYGKLTSAAETSSAMVMR